MRRVTPGVAVVALAGLAALTGCGTDAGAATTPSASNTPTNAPAAAPVAVSTLAGLAAAPTGFLKGAPGDPTQFSGPFTRQTFVDTLSGVPAEDLALLLNAGCKEGYQTFRLSPDRRKRVTVQLFKTASKPKAIDLQQGFWGQTEHAKAFAVPGLPGALTDARTEVVGVTGRIDAVAEASITVGTTVAEITVTQSGTLEKSPIPDVKLATAMIRLQHARLTSKSG